jgi:hypothetical protein
MGFLEQIWARPQSAEVGHMGLALWEPFCQSHTRAIHRFQCHVHKPSSVAASSWCVTAHLTMMALMVLGGSTNPPIVIYRKGPQCPLTTPHWARQNPRPPNRNQPHPNGAHQQWRRRWVQPTTPPMAHNSDEAGNGWNPPHNLSLREAQVIHENWLLMPHDSSSS